MGPVFVDQDPRIVVAIIGIAADVIAPVDEQDGFAALRRNPFCQHASGEACSDNQPVEGHAEAPRRVATAGFTRVDFAM